MKYRFCSETQWLANKCFLIKQRRKEKGGRERKERMGGPAWYSRLGTGAPQRGGEEPDTPMSTVLLHDVRWGPDGATVTDIAPPYSPKSCQGPLGHPRLRMSRFC